MKHHLLTALATLAGLFAAWSIARTQPQRSLRDPVVPPARPAFERTVAAVGMIEPSSETITVGSPHPGLVTAVMAKAGQAIRSGDPLFQLDDRHLRAAVSLQQSQVNTAKARVETARAQLEDLSDQLARAEKLESQTVVSTEEVTRKRFAARLAKARVTEAEAERDAAAASLRSAETELERSLVRSPIDGTVLQVKIKPGESIATGAAPGPLMLLGRLDPLHVRVDVDEHEGARVAAGAPATGHVRGHPQDSIPLRFVRLEPLVVPKKSLTGDAGERVDTRVLQAIYRIEPGRTNLFPGQQLDVFIEAR
ncbi:MAG: efflux RND transporter periplasmic adaptor subunit [Verrucomicrobiota bacterium]